MIDLILFIVYFFEMLAEPTNSVGGLFGSNESLSLLPSRRILSGHAVADTRPYMVYLRPASNVAKKITDTHWLCGGAIINERYILTSAACIEDVKNFYVISGTHTWVPPEVNDNECINNGAKRAIWKCEPQSYFFDGGEFENIRWMVGDIAVVKVEDDFNFERRIRGCDFIPKKVKFNNQSAQLEKSRTLASAAGWGSTDRFVDIDKDDPLPRSGNSVELLETDLVLISKKGCKKHWDPRYHFIINDEMICTKDNSVPQNQCAEHDVSCMGLQVSSEEDYSDDSPRPARRIKSQPNDLLLHTAAHRSPSRRDHMESGGFCENDHGGPLIVGQGMSSVIVGIMSACQTKNISNKCYGPFLYTSVYKYRNLISCAIEKNIANTCRALLRSGRTPIKETVFDWTSDPSRSSETKKNIARSFPEMTPKTQAHSSTKRVSQTTTRTPSAEILATKKTKQLSQYNMMTLDDITQNLGNRSLNKSTLKRKESSLTQAHPPKRTKPRRLNSRVKTQQSRISRKSRRRTTMDPYSSIKDLIMRRFITKMYK